MTNDKLNELDWTVFHEQRASIEQVRSFVQNSTVYFRIFTRSKKCIEFEGFSARMIELETKKFKYSDRIVVENPFTQAEDS